MNLRDAIRPAWKQPIRPPWISVVVAGEAPFDDCLPRRRQGFGGFSRSAAARRKSAPKTSISAGGRSDTAAKRSPPFGLLEQGKAVAGLRARLDRAADDGDRHFARGDLVLAALIDERRDPGGADDVYPTAHHGEPVRLEIDDGRGARDLARQPRLDRMPVRRRDTDRLPGKAAPDKAGDDAALGSA